MKVLLTIKELLGDFVSLVFPKICIHCGMPLVFQEEHLCTYCKLDLPKTNYHLIPDNPLKQKLIYEPKVQNVSAYLHFHKRGLAQSIIHQLKYKGYQEIGIEVGRWYGKDLLSANWPIDFIVPVPLHPTRLKKRGYNQSETIAGGISEVMAIPMKTDLVSRNVRTNTQTRKSKVQRLENVSSIYKIKEHKIFKGKNVMIVDDVLTTGATVGELAITIARETQVTSIYIVTIAAGE